MSDRPIVVVMGVSGSGKTTLGERLAAALGVPFQEGDALHPAANIAKMKAGVPLDDADRAPWLDAIARWMAARLVAGGGVVSCSALKHDYRDRLRQAGGGAVRFILLDVDPATLRARLAARQGHYMPVSLLDSQLATLERPTPGEHVLRLPGTEDAAAACAAAVAWITANTPA